MKNQSANDFIQIFVCCVLFKFNAVFYLSGDDTELFSMLSLITEWLSLGSLLLNKFFP